MPIDIRILTPPTADTPVFGNAGRVVDAVEVTTMERLYTAGYFEIKVPTQARHADRLVLGRLVLIERGFWGIVDDLKFTGDSGGDFVTVSGRQLKGLTEDRITIPPGCNAVTGAQGYDTVTASTETCMKHYASGNLGSGAAGARAIFGLEIGPDLVRGLAEDKYMSRHDVVADVLAELGEGAGLGYDIIPDLNRHRFVFDVMAGEDHTAEQSERTRVIFDLERNTARGQSYQYAAGDSRNVFYTTMDGAEFADEALTVTYLREGESEAAGIFRREKHLSLSAETPVAGEEYNELKRKALLSAEEFRAAESFACELLTGPYVYRQDFGLGDMVTVRNRRWGVALHTRLTEMKTVWSASGAGCTATLGTAPLGVFGRIRRQIRKGV